MLNELEKDKIQGLLGDEMMLGILRKIFGETVRRIQPEVSKGDTNEVLGEKYRAYEEAKIIVDAAFQNLLSLKIEKVDKSENFNRGR